MELLRSVVGHKTLDRFKEEQMSDYFDLLREFEHKKRTISNNQSSNWVQMRIPISLVEIFEEETGKKMKDVIKEKADDDEMSFARDKLRFSMERMKKFFEFSIQGIVSHVEKILSKNELRSVNTILLVGGYSECEYLQERIKSSLPGKHLIIPEEAGFTILKGAVLFGHRPSAVSSRILRYTYGYRTRSIFIPGLHPESLKFSRNGFTYVRGIFSMVKHIGERVNNGEIVNRVHNRDADGDHYDNASSFPLFYSPSLCPRYTIEPCCTELGSLIIEHLPYRGQDRIVEFQLIFGDTELQAKARDLETGKMCEAVFDFLG